MAMDRPMTHAVAVVALLLMGSLAFLGESCDTPAAAVGYRCFMQEVRTHA